MPKISAVIITYNEEKNLKRCLDSVKDVVDEIIVVDSFSDDSTIDIALKYTPHVTSQKFLGHVEQKNFAMQKASNDWVLSLDADEELSEELQKDISSIKNQEVNDKIAFTVNRLTNYCGKWIKHSGWYPDWKIRLWNRNSGLWGGINPHDTIIISEGVKINKLKGALLHYSFHSIDQHIDQIQKFSTIAALEAQKKGERGLLISIIIYPIIFFIKRYIFKLGFLDGFYGFIVCANSAYFKMLKYIKLRDLYLKKPN